MSGDSEAFRTRLNSDNGPFLTESEGEYQDRQFSKIVPSFLRGGQFNRSGAEVGSDIRPTSILEILNEALKNLTLIEGTLNEVNLHIDGPQPEIGNASGAHQQTISLRDYALEIDCRASHLAQIALAIREKL